MQKSPGCIEQSSPREVGWVTDHVGFGDCSRLLLWLKWGALQGFEQRYDKAIFNFYRLLCGKGEIGRSVRRLLY